MKKKSFQQGLDIVHTIMQNYYIMASNTLDGKIKVSFIRAQFINDAAIDKCHDMMMRYGFTQSEENGDDYILVTGSK